MVGFPEFLSDFNWKTQQEPQYFPIDNQPAYSRYSGISGNIYIPSIPYLDLLLVNIKIPEHPFPLGMSKAKEQVASMINAGKKLVQDEARKNLWPTVYISHQKDGF